MFSAYTERFDLISPPVLLALSLSLPPSPPFLSHVYESELWATYYAVDERIYRLKVTRRLVILIELT